MMKRNNTVTILISLLLIAFLCTMVFIGNSSKKEPVKTNLFAMDTIMSFTLYGEKENCTAASDALSGEIIRLEKLLSATDTSSEVYKLNQDGQLTNASDDTLFLIERAVETSNLTDGLFDISVYPLVELWGFPTDECHVPSDTDLHSKRNLIDYTKISVNKPTKSVSFEEKGMKITLGGIAKGYVSDRAVKILHENGVESALLSLGGNIVAVGEKPDGSLWQVAIAHPDGDGKLLGAVSVKNKCVISSGGYERYFEENGVNYHHILDPQTGYPAENGLTSVTIITEDGTMGDALSTALYVMGKENACDFWRRRSADFDMVLATSEGKILVSEGIADSFSCEDEFQIITR